MRSTTPSSSDESIRASSTSASPRLEWGSSASSSATPFRPVAMTVHGVQGETADASVVGPDADAAGLYVGLTRGRVHNVALVVART